ncbi:glycosyltransferase family 2 protein [Aeromonas caviae]|uniref:glycosyltransferase family 2 protein n=1 Tax=Aeromonas caviae TaxID=648 RepID=UPI0024C6736B|nr:glycosyltransferase family 2 protein [Aeromonas caviae]WAF65557.1 glycosyltransferase family 2 protein [Aeromonas caviae]WAF82383.1 glycosyltransferase family 2 protein [Aeromonas caviae]
MHVNKISLIGTSQGGREFEVERLFRSLVGTFNFLEVIFIDQSDDYEIESLVNKYKNKVNIILLNTPKLSLSKARNMGLDICSGNIIGFCDDDAFYDYESLLRLSEFEFTQNELVSVPVIDKSSGKMYGDRAFPKRSKNISFLEIIRCSISVGTFILLHDRTEDIIFDERLGAGTYLGGSEETELFFRLKSGGFITTYNNSIFVYHDNDASIDTSKMDLSAKYYKYALGYGLVLRTFLIKSKFTLALEVINITLRCILGAVLMKNRSIYINRLRGFYRGLLYEGRLNK